MKKSDLLPRLRLLKRVLGSEPAVYGCYLFTDNKIVAYDGFSLAIEASFPNTVGFAVEGKVLLGLLENSSAENINMTKEKNEVRLTAGKSVIKLPYFAEDEFDFDPDVSGEVSATLSLDDNFINNMDVALDTVCDDKTMPALIGICFNFTGKTPYLYSTDGDAITRVAIEGEGKGVFTAPKAFCEALKAAWFEAESKEGTIIFTDDWVQAALNGYTLYGRALQTPIDHEALITDTLRRDTTFRELPEGFSEALARARVLADDESKPTLLTAYNGTLGLLTESKLGEVRDMLDFKGHEDVEAMVSAELVERATRVCSHMAILENCTAFTKRESILQIVSNLGT